ncbi:PREDICTED: leucine-rich repeat-containing protein 3C [Chrysochloris asiatica]|uniref:Leucine-rich repeat-containing protein 3C n=1 Tax=Chrysochloris asiatica TaxID=185453 RepID=A0A9B0T457_CHRAS|nr:PREDICTED: leucine-rich repeat-containing protein 3C [Chrysochloris asiatica]
MGSWNTHQQPPRPDLHLDIPPAPFFSALPTLTSILSSEHLFPGPRRLPNLYPRSRASPRPPPSGGTSLLDAPTPSSHLHYPLNTPSVDAAPPAPLLLSGSPPTRVLSPAAPAPLSPRRSPGVLPAPPAWRPVRTHPAGPEVKGPEKVPRGGGGGRCCSSSCKNPRRQPPRWQLRPNQLLEPAPVTSPPGAKPPGASWELSDSTPGLCQPVTMLRLARRLLSLLLVINAGSPMPSPQTLPQGCYLAEEAGERTFRCSQAGLNAVPAGIPNDTRKLYLDANHLESVPAGAFHHLPVLEELDLSHNALVLLSGAAFQGLAHTLHHLDLSANQLASVPVEAFMGLQIQVNLSANPWRCDCALLEVIRRVRLAPGTGMGIVCGPGARPDLVGQEFLPLAGEEELCGTGRGGAQRNTDVALLVTMGGWLALVVVYLIHYMRQNRDEIRRPFTQAPDLPVRAEGSSTLSTAV